MVVVAGILAFMIGFKQTETVGPAEKQSISATMTQVEKHKQQLQATAMAAKQKVDEYAQKQTGQKSDGQTGS